MISNRVAFCKAGILFGSNDATMSNTIDSRVPVAYINASGHGLYGMLD